MEIIKASLMAAVSQGGGSANLGSVTFTENDTYTPTAPLDGWNEVTVAVPLTERTFTANGDYTNSSGGWNLIHINVPTYYDEWQDAIEQLEHMQECCEAVVQTLQKYDPDFDPEDCEDIPPEIDDIIGDASGYTFPDGTEYPDIQPLVAGDDIIEDTSVDGYPYMYIIETHNNTWGMSCGYVSGGVFIGVIGWDFGIDTADEKPTVQSVKMIDSNTGYVEYTARYWLWGDYHTQTLHATIQELVGYGESGHTYRVRNS